MPGRTTRILLVEDNPGDARYIRELLREAEPLEERAVEDGAFIDGDGAAFGIASADDDDTEGEIVQKSRLGPALDHLDSEPVDVVLLDLDLPDSQGLETLTSILDHDETVPVVVLTGISDREVGVDALRRGAAEFLVKDEINPGLLLRSIHHAIERQAHHREQKLYETLIEESTDVNAIIDLSGTFEYITPSAKHVLGYDPERIVGDTAFDYIHPDDVDSVREEFDRLVANPDYQATVDFRFEHADGSWVYLNARGRNLLDEPEIGGLVVYTRDVTEQREYERQLETQRERLAALNQLNGVVHGVTEAVIEQSTREEIEQIACERLASSESYEFAWIGEPDLDTDSVAVRAEAGTGDYLEQLSLSIAADDSEPTGPTAAALHTSELQTVLDVHSNPAYEPWRELADEYGFQSSAAIPIRYENTTYGVLNVYADRAEAFREQERTVIEHLGRLIGHAISAAKRKRALMSDSVVELELRVDIADGLDDGLTPSDPVTFERTIPLADGEFLVYGTAPVDEFDALERMTEALSAWETVSKLDDQNDEAVRFELQLSDPPLMSKIASLGGSIEQAVVSDDLQMTVHLPQDVETRQVVDAVQAEHDGVEAIAHRQVSKTDDRDQRLADVWGDEFTDRQRTVVETAYYAGFFEWPRATSGEEVAEKLDISGPTFSQHLRAAENKLFGRLVGGDQSDAGDERDTGT
jgi:PAS domain S-box-containing protein